MNLGIVYNVAAEFFPFYRLDNKNLKFFKKYSIIAQCKALNGRISEWAYFLNLGKQFKKYSHFSASKKGVFVGKNLKGTSH